MNSPTAVKPNEDYHLIISEELQAKEITLIKEEQIKRLKQNLKNII